MPIIPVKTSDYLTAGLSFRAEINAPTTSRVFHEYHGRRGIYVPREERFYLLDENTTLYISRDLAARLLHPIGESYFSRYII